MKRRNTPAKTAVLNILEQAKSAMSQDSIESMAKGEMDRVTIYRVLNRFCEDGITHRVLADDGKYYFALCRSCEGENHNHDHFHFRCLGCSKVECLTQHVTVVMPEGYRQTAISSWVTGYCRNC
jgi:Fur family ferric uptake transcriptional regulator